MDAELKKKIQEHYMKGDGSIQDIARSYRLSVDEVLHALDMDDMTQVQTTGDLIDQEEAGLNTVISSGEKHKIHYSTD